MINSRFTLSRIYKLRVIEHRVAAIQSAKAQIALANLLQMNQRLLTLQHGLNPTAGTATGGLLKSNAEMLLRLKSARISIAHPIGDAQITLSQSSASRNKARQKKDSVAKLLDVAISAETAALALRADANRPFRRRVMLLGDDA